MGNCNLLPVSYLTFKYKLLQEICDHFKSSCSDWGRELPLERLPRSEEETAVKDHGSYKPINYAWIETKPKKPKKKKKRQYH